MPPEIADNYPDTGDFIGIVGNERSVSLLEKAAAGLKRVPELPFESLIVPGNGELLPETRLSDHSPFWDAGHQALMITDTSFYRNPHYHQPTDTADTIDFDFLTQVTAGVYQAMRIVLGVA